MVSAIGGGNQSAEGYSNQRAASIISVKLASAKQYRRNLHETPAWHQIATALCA